MDMRTDAPAHLLLDSASGWRPAAGAADPLPEPVQDRDALVLPPGVREAALVTVPLDSGISRCRWHRIRVDADVPSGSALVVQLATTGDDPDGVPGPDDWQTAAGPAYDFLVDQPPGQYLVLRLLLGRTDASTPGPAVRQVRLDLPGPPLPISSRPSTARTRPPTTSPSGSSPCSTRWSRPSTGPRNGPPHCSTRPACRTVCCRGSRVCSASIWGPTPTRRRARVPAAAPQAARPPARRTRGPRSSRRPYCADSSPRHPSCAGGAAHPAGSPLRCTSCWGYARRSWNRPLRRGVRWAGTRAWVRCGCSGGRRRGCGSAAPRSSVRGWQEPAPAGAERRCVRSATRTTTR